MKNRLTAILVILSLFASIFVALPIAFAVPAVVVEPALSEFYSDTSPVGTTFEISIIAYDIPDTGWFGWELYLYWTAGVVDCVGETLNGAIWSPNSGPLVAIPIDNVAGTYHQGVAGRSPSPTASGTHWLANLTFQIVEEVTSTTTPLTTDFTLGPAPGLTYILVTQLVDEIPHDFVDGEYRYHWAAPTTLPWLEVVPNNNIFAGKNIYKTPFSFSVDIMIRDVVAGWELGGVELLLFYNTTVLDVLEVGNGTFFEPFTSLPTFQLHQIFESEGKIRIAYGLFSVDTYPNGDGKIASILFNATHQEQFPIAVWSDLDIEIDTENGMTSYFVKALSGDELPYEPEVDGYYELAGYVIGRVIDVYTQYPDPYGGQGPMQPSDMFWPQKEVCLFANVTYNEWPVQNKLVAFEIRDPQGVLIDILTATSDEYGVATACFRIPWPCDDPESLFGVWTVTATVDIACIVVNDTLQFHFDYLVHWIDVYTDKDEYGHCEEIKVTVEFGSHSMMNRTVLLAVSIHDELGYPFGVAYIEVFVGGATWCTLKPYLFDLYVHVVKWAAAGTATVYANAYSDWPSMGGSPWAPTYTPPPEINILAIWA